ncbi:MAG: bifunctional class I SAM-dependent methyltransferase/glycosyltransferase family 2 protein [Desulfobulbaceae bacterium]|nr:bifunctional class I SAM-dependent methyltransferase/glycosyltransferase family 2 protein [Desulfobulbaceae bacterium]
MNKEERIQHFNKLAPERARWRRKGKYYHKKMEEYLRFLVPAGASVLEIGCGTGELLASLEPGRGVGIDISPEMVAVARTNFPDLEFQVDDFEHLEITETFDYVIIAETIGHVDDIQAAFHQLHKVCTPETRVITIYYNYLWAPVMKFAEFARLRMPQSLQHWLPLEDIANLLYLEDFDVVKKGYRVLMPINIPLISTFCNTFLANMPFFWKLALTEILVARPMAPRKVPEKVTCTVLVPCRNEKGNIEDAVLRTPEMGAEMEIIYVEGGSSDGTFEECLRIQEKYPDKDITVLQQDGRGKGDAVRKGFAAAKHDVLMILDADLTVPPEDLPKFFDAIVSGKGEFINGSRLVYRMEKQAMRFLNILGNKFFSRAFTYLFEQRIRDTLCGTKVLWRDDYNKIVAGRSYFGEFDPFGDFDLLFGAVKLNLKIIEVPIRYRDRTYGSTQISRFRHGVLLLKMTWFGLFKIKWI